MVILAAHSMPSAGRRVFGGRAVRRADVVPGTRGRSTADGRIIDLVDAHFRSAGLSVKHDDPYRGGWSPSHYGPPREGWHAVQIELNRARVPELCLLPGIGPALAGRIVAARARGVHFACARDLQEIRGIGPRVAARLEPYLVFEAGHRDSAPDRHSASVAPADRSETGNFPQEGTDRSDKP